MAKPDSSNTPNPNNSIDDQNFDVDINQLYQHWIVPLDQIRSYASINGQNSALIKALQKSGIKDLKQISGLVKPETTIQESRCHAFYRWIGFPVTGNGNKQIFNPGHDIIKDPARTIKDADKVSIANSPADGFNKLSEERENFSLKMSKIFSQPKSTSAGVLALSNGGNVTLRKFNAPFEKNTSINAFDMTVTNQQYEVDFTVRVGRAYTTLDLFRNNNADKPTAVEKTRLHIITPFAVDPRIDFTVFPQTRLIAVPFVPDASFLQIGAVGTGIVRRPLLERIIRRRFTVSDDEDSSGTNTNSIKEIIATFPDIKDEALIKLANGEQGALLKTSEQIQLNTSINTIKSMMDKLVKARKAIEKAQGQHYWLPAPSTSGPEKGSSVQKVFVPTVIDPDRTKKLITPQDTDIFVAQIRGDTSAVTSDGNAATGSPDDSAYGIPADKTTFDTDTTDAMGDNNATNLGSLNDQRTQLLSDANDALQIVEIILGDFSGFGLCDIIAIIGSLNVIPKENLLGFLDADSLTRAQTAVKEIKGVTPATYENAQKALAQSVKDFYTLMDKIYQDIKTKGIAS